MFTSYPLDPTLTVLSNWTLEQLLMKFQTKENSELRLWPTDDEFKTQTLDRKDH